MSEKELNETLVVPMIAVRMLAPFYEQAIVEMADPYGNLYQVPFCLFPEDANNGDGRLYEVKLLDGISPVEVNISILNVDDLFPTEVGYMLHYDDKYKYYHIYDNQSRHFVATAEGMSLTLKAGDFVTFSPIIPTSSKFKSAIVIRKESKKDGIAKFGTFDIEIMDVNKEECWYRYKVLNELPELEEGWFREIGVSYLSKEEIDKLSIGDSRKVIMFLKRAKDKEKYNYIAELLND